MKTFSFKSHLLLLALIVSQFVLRADFLSSIQDAKGIVNEFVHNLWSSLGNITF